MKNYLLELNSDERFRLLVAHAKKQRPIVPNYDPKSDNTSDWKHKSAMQQGFDLCAQIFGIKQEK